MGSEEIGNPNSPKGYARKNITLHRLRGNHKRGIAVRRVMQEQEKTMVTIYISIFVKMLNK